MSNAAVDQENVDWERYVLLMDCAHMNRNIADGIAKAWLRLHQGEWMALEDRYPAFQGRFWARCLYNAQAAAKERGGAPEGQRSRAQGPDWKSKAAHDE